MSFFQVQRIPDDVKVFFIFGMGGSGKTTLIREFMKKHKNSGDYEVDCIFRTSYIVQEVFMPLLVEHQRTNYPNGVIPSRTFDKTKKKYYVIDESNNKVYNNVVGYKEYWKLHENEIDILFNVIVNKGIVYEIYRRIASRKRGLVLLVDFPTSQTLPIDMMLELLYSKGSVGVSLVLLGVSDVVRRERIVKRGGEQNVNELMKMDDVFKGYLFDFVLDTSDLDVKGVLRTFEGYVEKYVKKAGKIVENCVRKKIEKRKEIVVKEKGYNCVCHGDFSNIVDVIRKKWITIEVNHAVFDKKKCVVGDKKMLLKVKEKVNNVRILFDNIDVKGTVFYHIQKIEMK